MINVTVWYEAVEERGELRPEFMPAGIPEERKGHLEALIAKNVAEIKEVYPDGHLKTLANTLNQNEDMNVTYTSLFDPEYGLPDELLDKTDVLIWWGHIAHHAVPDELAYKVVARVQRGMGFIGLHSAHLSIPSPRASLKPLSWSGKRCTASLSISPSRTICSSPTGTGAASCSAAAPPGPGATARFSISSRATRRSPPIIIENAVRWVAPAQWIEKLESPRIEKSPEELLR